MPTKPAPVRQPHVVILGGGFAGLTAARALRKAPVRVTLIDRRNHHLFQPLLYQVATAALNPGDIAYPIRSVLSSQANARTLLARVDGIDLARSEVQLDDEVMPFDYLLVATGATHSYFGQNQFEQWAPGLKTIEDALEIRRRVLSAFEAAERMRDPAQLRPTLTFVVVGAGPTGVELAGSLAEIGHQTVAKDFRAFDPTAIRVVLVEGTDRVLPPYSPRLSASAQQQLAKLGVEVRLGAKVTKIDESGVWLGDEHIAARTVLWAAGVAASPLGKALTVPLDRAGRVMVQPDLSAPGHGNVFVAGDLMHFEQDGKPVPAWRRPRSRPARPSRATSRRWSPASRPGRSATSTRARWQRSAARRRSAPSAAWSSPASSPGGCGGSCTSPT